MKTNSKRLLATAAAICLSAAMASTANAAIGSLLPDPAAYVTSEDWGSGALPNAWAGDHSGTYLIGQANIGWQPSGTYSGAAIATGADSDGYAGDSLNSHTVVFDMGSSVTFGGFLHAQRHQATGDSVKTMQFWVTDTDPGSDTTAIASTYFGTTPDASVDVNIGNRFLYSYEFGADLTGRYVVMRWISNGTANPGAYVFQLGQAVAAGGVNSDTSTVVASPFAVLANGMETSTITVTLKDASEVPVSGKLVTLDGDTDNASIDPAGAGADTTNANGVATFTVKSSTVETETFTATGDSVPITQTASVQFLPVVTTPPVITPVATKQSTRAASTLGVSNLFNGAGMYASETFMYDLDGNQAGEPTGASGVLWEATLASLVAQDFIDGKFWLVFDLGASHALDSIGLWNYQNNGAPTTRGVNQFDVYVRNAEADTDDGTTEGTPINPNNTGGAPIDAFNPGTSNPWQLALADQTLNQAPNDDSNAAQSFSLTGNTARFVAIVIDSNHVNNKMGLGKVRIYENTAPPGDDYASWSGGAPANGDANGDGVPNAVAYALGASNVNENAISRLPSFNNSDPSNIVFTFDRSDAAEADGTTTITVEYGSTLSGWTTAADGVGGVSIDDSAVPSAGLHTVVVTIPKSGNKLFARLKVVVEP